MLLVNLYIKDMLTSKKQKQRIDRVASAINFQKFVYLLTISPLNTASPTTKKTITAFITGTLKLYVSALSLGSSLLVTDNQYGDDAALLAIMGLIRLYTLSPNDQSPLYQSVQILETLLQKSKHNYQALLLLVRIYLLLGAIGAAIDIYPRLNIKQIQNDTLSHSVLTRISTLFPNDARTSSYLRNALDIYESSRAQTPNMLQLAFERGGYAQMMGFLEFSERVEGSVCRTMWEIELRRLARIVSGFPEQDVPAEVGYKGAVWDNRDFAVIIDCELTSVGPFERSFRIGPTPAENWVRGFAAAEEVSEFFRTFLAAGKDSNGAAMANEKPTFAADVAGRIAVALKAGDQHDEFTEAEKSRLLLAEAIAELATAALKKDGEAVSKVLEGITAELFPKTFVAPAADETPDWRQLHALWMGREATSVAESLVKFLNAIKGLKPGVPKPSITALTEAAKKRKTEVLELAKSALKRLEDEDAIQTLVDDVLKEEGVGGVLRRQEAVFGGVEQVADNVGKTRNAIVRSYESF